MKLANIVLCILLSFSSLSVQSAPQGFEQYNIRWDSPSQNAGESMPVGGHDIGANVWLEDNAIYFYFGRSNSFDENNALLKSERIKLTLSPNPFATVRQEIKQQVLLSLKDSLWNPLKDLVFGGG